MLGCSVSLKLRSKSFLEQTQDDTGSWTLYSRHDSNLSLFWDLGIFHGLDKVLFDTISKQNAIPSVSLRGISDAEVLAALLNRLDCSTADDFVGHRGRRWESGVE